MSAGYSGTPLAKKLGIKAAARVRFVEAPHQFQALLEPMPEGVVAAEDELDVVVAFGKDRVAVERHLQEAMPRMKPNAGLWVAWPKRSSGVPTELTEDVVREIGLAAGLVDNKVCAIDGTWSGLRFVRRLADRPKTPPASRR